MKKIFFLCIALSCTSLFSQSKENQEETDYKLGSKDQVDNQLAQDKTSFFEFDFMKSYFDSKSKLKEKSGFDFGVDYSSVYFGASESLGDKSTGAGMVRLYGSWELVNKGSKNNGALIYKIEHRHKYTEITPKNFGFEIGYVGMQVPAFNEDGFRMTNFYWRQRLLDGKLSFVAGLLDATDYVDVYAYASPWTGFMNFQFSTGSEAVYIPNDAALGAAVAMYLTDNIYGIASISDAGSDPTKPWNNFDSFFSNGNYFKSLEFGYTTGKDRFFFDNIHLTFWHSDGTPVTASLPGWGVAFSATHYFKNGIHPFLRGGYAKDGGTLLQKSLVGGFAYQTTKQGSLLGVSLGWGEVNETSFGSGLANQITAEVFYKINFSNRFAISPDVQYLINPVLDPTNSSIFIAGVRGRIAL